jgi:multidrug resistance protein, MATE family
LSIATDAAEIPGRTGTLPAQRIDAAGATHVDFGAVLHLAVPFMLGSAVQIVMNLTDVWFIGHISTRALAAAGSVQWLILAVVLVLSGVGMAVQTLVAQAEGAGDYARAARATWSALWATLSVTPIFLAAGACGHLILLPFGLPPETQHLAVQFWFTRVAGAAFGAGLWAMMAFFNGIGASRTSLLVSFSTAAINVLFNQIFIFHLGLGIAGSGLATTAAQACGLAVGLAIFLRPYYRRRYESQRMWRPRRAEILAQLRIGFPMGLLPAADLLGFSIFQMMQVRLDTVSGAATQLVMMLTSVSYAPAFGIALAGTTLVGQSIGAGDRAWAMRIGTGSIVLAVAYMGGIGILLAIAGPWVLPFFASGDDSSPAVIALSARLLWLAAGYQIFDGLNLGASQCLRGAGDATVPAALVLPLSWLLFVPLAHSLTFAPGQGWVGFLPQLGWGATGGWLAVLIYMIVLGTVLYLRWHSRAWQRIHLFNA